MSIKPNPEHHKRLIAMASLLKELRFNVGLTQQELSQLLNLHRNTIHRAENFHNMTLSTLFQLADAYEISLSQLFQDIE